MIANVLLSLFAAIVFIGYLIFCVMLILTEAKLVGFVGVALAGLILTWRFYVDLDG